MTVTLREVHYGLDHNVTKTKAVHSWQPPSQDALPMSGFLQQGRAHELHRHFGRSVQYIQVPLVPMQDCFTCVTSI
jgi:hypothetical protein